MLYFTINRKDGKELQVFISAEKHGHTRFIIMKMENKKLLQKVVLKLRLRQKMHPF